MSATLDLGELQSILIGASRCLDCRDPRCMTMCPEHVNVQKAMRLIMTRMPHSRGGTWMQQADEATTNAAEGVQASFESAD